MLIKRQLFVFSLFWVIDPSKPEDKPVPPVLASHVLRLPPVPDRTMKHAATSSGVSPKTSRTVVIPTVKPPENLEGGVASPGAGSTSHVVADPSLCLPIEKDDLPDESSDTDDEPQPIPVYAERPTRRPKKTEGRSERLGSKSSQTGTGDAVGVGTTASSTQK
jgi:hypothetical protein